VPTPIWLFMKAAQMAGMSIDVMSNVRYYIDDHKRGAFKLLADSVVIHVFQIQNGFIQRFDIRDV